MEGTEREWHVETDDGCTWIVSWFEEDGAFFAQAWRFDEENDDRALEAEEEAVCTCPGPTCGAFDALETIEAAMGQPIPPGVREDLLAEQRLHPQPEHLQEGWGTAYAFEVHRIGRDGGVVGSLAPPWADDPESGRWDLDW